MRAFAWVRVQRAELARSLGDLDRAARLLADADRAYPGWWYVSAHTAALDAAAGRCDRAVTGYRSVLAEVDRPDFREALGSALAGHRAADAAAAARAAALAAYLASVARGEVHYLHHLAAIHADVHPPRPRWPGPGGRRGPSQRDDAVAAGLVPVPRGPPRRGAGRARRGVRAGRRAIRCSGHGPARSGRDST